MRAIKHNSLDGYSRLRGPGAPDIRGKGAGRSLAPQSDWLLR